MRATDLVGGPFTPPGFYYKTFIRPRKLWPLYEKVLRHAAGLGVLRKAAGRARVADRVPPPPRRRARRRRRDRRLRPRSPPPAGADVVLVDEGPSRRSLLSTATSGARLADRAASAGVEILSRRLGARLLRRDGPGLAGRHAAPDPRARATCSRPARSSSRSCSPATTCPGVMLSGGALRLAALYAVSPGTRAVVATTSRPRARGRGRRCTTPASQIVAVADLRAEPTRRRPRLAERGIEVLTDHTIVEAKGRKAVERRGARADRRRGRVGEQTFDCDLVVVSGGFAPATSLLAPGRRAQRATTPTAGHFALTELPADVYAAGEVAGVDDAEAAARSGERAGLRGGAGARARRRATREPSALAEPRRRSPVAVPPPVAGAGRGKCFACLCEDVTAKDIHLSVEEGYDSIELSKRYTTVTMGPCQGRMCQLPAIRLMAKETGPEPRAGRHDDRAPAVGRRCRWASSPAGRSSRPSARRSTAATASSARTIKWAGDWRRAYDYGDPQGEALAVHRAAGLIDVSTLGKLLVRGPEAGEFLDRLYPNRFATSSRAGSATA